MVALPAAQGNPKLEKAYLTLLAPVAPGAGSNSAIASTAARRSGGGAAGGGGGGLGQLVFRFNPKEYTVQKTANWQRRPLPGAKEATIPQFTGSDPRSLSLEVFLDATESPSGSVVKDVELLFSCCTPTSNSLRMKQPSPPFVMFGWGSTMSFLAFVKSVSAKFTLFKQDGTPVRAVCQVSLEEIPAPTAKQNPTSGTLTAHRTYQVTAGETLQSIAYQEYRDPNLWRAIAEVNGIDDPMRVASGTELLLPSPTDAAAITGAGEDDDEAAAEEVLA